MAKRNRSGQRAVSPAALKRDVLELNTQVKTALAAFGEGIGQVIQTRKEQTPAEASMINAVISDIATYNEQVQGIEKRHAQLDTADNLSASLDLGSAYIAILESAQATITPLMAELTTLKEAT